MLIAPHPDDEALACSVVLQRAVRANVPVGVVYVTDGDNNPWPQRVLEKKWRLDNVDRQRWGRLRRNEARAIQAREVFPHKVDHHQDAVRCDDRRGQVGEDA